MTNNPISTSFDPVGTNPSAVQGSAKLIVDSPHDLARWRPLVQWILYIPHYVLVYVLGSVASVVGFIYWLIVVFTARPNKSLYDFSAMILRYEVRAGLFLVGFSEQFPPFAFSQGGSDDGAYPPVRLELPAPPETVSRKVALNGILAIPHYVVIMVYSVAAMFVLLIAWFAVIITGRWPADMRDFITRLTSYYARIWAYVHMVDNRYPSFALD